MHTRPASRFANNVAFATRVAVAATVLNNNANNNNRHRGRAGV
jgi:hypothetical protein